MSAHPAEALLGPLLLEGAPFPDRAHAALADLFPGRLAVTETVKEAATLEELLAIKGESDRRHYSVKHRRLRTLIDRAPDDWFIDSRSDPVHNIVGITHRPTGFRYHAPLQVLPAGLRDAQPPAPSPSVLAEVVP